MAHTLEELKEKLKGLHHATKEAKELKEKISEMEDGGDNDGETVKAEVTKKEKITKKVEEEYKFEIDPEKVYKFKLEQERQYYTLPVQSLVWDEDKKKLRKIRYTESEESAYVDEQDELAQPSRREIRFLRGELLASGKNKALINYLLAFDGNAEKKKINPSNRMLYNNLYRLVDEGGKVRQSREKREKVRKAMNVVADAPTEDIVSFLNSVFGFNKAEIKVDNFEDVLYDKALQYAQSNPDAFLEDFNNPRHKIKADVREGFLQGLLDLDKNDTIKWKSTGGEIHKGDPNKRADEVLTIWVLSSKEGKDFYEELGNRLK